MISKVFVDLLTETNTKIHTWVISTINQNYHLPGPITSLRNVLLLIELLDELQIQDVSNINECELMMFRV